MAQFTEMHKISISDVKIEINATSNKVQNKLVRFLSNSFSLTNVTCFDMIVAHLAAALRITVSGTALWVNWVEKAVWKLPVAKNSDSLAIVVSTARIFHHRLAIPEVRPIGMVLVIGVLAGYGNGGEVFAPATEIRCDAIRKSHNFNNL